MIDLKWCEVHSPIFLAGTNLGVKLDPSKRQGLKLQYDREHKELVIGWNKEEAIIPSSNVATMVIGLLPNANYVEPVRGKVVAQVSTPQDHVFKGEGAGKTK
jgi:hypothetical protein